MAVPSKTVSQDTQAQLARLRRENRALRAQLHRAQRLATVGTMTAMIAHEFNNILTPIISYAEMARKNPALAAKAIDRAADGGQRASSIANAILGIARDEQSQEETFALAELIDRTLEAMARPPQRDRIEVVVDVAPDLAISTRRVELQHVLLNLLLNARAAVLAKESARRIEISARRRGGKVAICVRDNGMGIRPEDARRIFQPFYSTKDPGEGDLGGHGLGLAICHDIVTALGGSICVQSTPGRGAAFTVSLRE